MCHMRLTPRTQGLSGVFAAPSLKASKSVAGEAVT